MHPLRARQGLLPSWPMLVLGLEYKTHDIYVCERERLGSMVFVGWASLKSGEGGTVVVGYL